MKNETQKLYITSLKYDSWQKRIYLQGDGSEQGQINFRNVLCELEKIGADSKDWNDYYAKAINHFSINGFHRIQK